MNRIVTTLVATAAFVASSSFGFAATAFTEDFSGLALPSNMSQVLAGTTDYSAADAEFEGARHYLRTNETDYSGVSFVFEGTLTIGATDSGGTAFLGMGGGAFDGSFATPANPNLYAEIGPAGFASGFFRGNDNSAQVGPLHGQGNGGWGGGTVHRVRLTWDADTLQAIVEIDQGFTGVFSADFSQALDGSDNGFTAANAPLFIGGGNNATWDDLSVSVVPTPAALPAGLALIGLAVKRRQRRNK